MKYDERIMQDVLAAKRVAYTIFWFGLFGILLFRWFVNGQSLAETIDIFIVWIIASFVHFFLIASKGVPMFYPFSATKREQRTMTIAIPILTMILTAGLVFIRGGNWTQIVVGGAFAFLITAFLYGAYHVILTWWERRNI